jgi:hypothetical protein
MRKIALILCMLLFAFAACKKEETTKHELRVKSDFVFPLHVKVGPNDYGEINTGATTAYQEIQEGNHAVTGTVGDTLTVLQGSMTIQGEGEHKWTMTVGLMGGSTLTED